MNKDDKIYVAGHTGMVGATLVRQLKEKGYNNIITCARSNLDLMDQKAVADFFASTRPDHVFMTAGKTGGIYANNTYRADFLYENIMIQSNVIHQSFLHEVQKLIFFACSCIYPKDCSQPMNEESVLSGKLEPTNEPFAVAKIAGLKMCESYNRQYGAEYISIIPTNVYGPNQRYEPMNSLVVPSLIDKFHKAKEAEIDSVSIWGTGKPIRDFIYVDDLADASIFLMEEYEGNVLLNIGTGRKCSIAELAEVVRKEVGFKGHVVFDPSKPDGVPEKMQDLSKIASLGWRPKIDLEEGIHLSYQNYMSGCKS